VRFILGVSPGLKVGTVGQGELVGEGGGAGAIIYFNLN